nr:hypothetical protein [Tanacetum cinerariifolium]
MQTQTSNTLHNAIMEAGSKDRPPMLAPGNYIQWKSRIKRYIDTKPNHELIHYCLKNPPYELGWKDKAVPDSDGRIDNDIYSTVDACLNACEMWKAIERFKQGKSINVQDFKTNLYWEFRKFTSQDGKSLESYYSRFYKMMNELIRNQCKVTNHQVNVQFLLQLQPEWQRSQQAATRNRGKAIVNSLQPIYDQEPLMVAEDDETSKDKEIDKLIALISLSFKKIYKPTNNNLQTLSNTSCANQDNSLRINRSAGYENQRNGNIAGARETVGLSVVQKSGIQCYNYKEFRHVARECQKPKRVKDATYHREKILLSHYMYMAQLQEVSPDAADSGPIFDDEPLQKNDDDNDLAKEHELLASLIEKLKCEIDENKNHNKFLETSNKDLIEKLKGEIKDFKNKNKSLESSNNFFKEANNKLSKTNNLLYADYKKSQAELARRNSKEYALQMELECAKVRGDLLSYKMDYQKSCTKYTETINDSNQTISELKDKLSAHQDTISILSQQKEAQSKLYKTKEDKELEKVIELENKVKVLDNIVYKTGQSVQMMNMLNNKCQMSFAKPEILKKAKRANPRLYDIGCYNDNLALMLAPESDEVIRIEKESRSKCLNEEMVADLGYFNSLELEVDSLTSQLETQRTQFVNEIDRLSREYYYADHMNAILGVYTELDEVTNLQCDYLELLEKCKCLETELSKSRMMSKSFESVQKHAINLELELQQYLKAQLQDKGIVISELKKLIEKIKGKSVDTKFEKSSVIRQPNAFKSQRPSVLGKPTTFSNYFIRKDFSKSMSVTQTHVSNDFSKPVNAQTLPTNKKSILKNTNVLAPGMYKLHTDHTQTKTSQLPQDSRKTNKHVSFSTGVIPTTSVSRPPLKSNPQGDRVKHNNSRGKKQEVEDQRRSVKLSKNKTSVTACNDSLNAKTLNVKSVSSICDICVLIDKHDMCLLNSVAKSIKKTVASESNKKPKNFTRKLYEHVSKTCSWWYPKFTPSGYKWKPKFGKENVHPNLVEIFLFIIDSGCSKNMTGNLKLLINFFEKFLGTVKFGNDQIAPILGYGDLVQGAVTIKRVYYVEGLNHNLFSVGSRGTDLYSIKLQDTNSPNPICLMAKATSSQAWLWHRSLSHLNFDTINLLSKNDIVVGLPKLKFVKDHLCFSCELGKAKRKSFHTKLTPSSTRQLQLLHMDLCGPMRVASINGKKYVLVIVDDYSRYTWTYFLRSKDETPEVLIDFLRLVQRGLQAQVRVNRTDKGTEFLNQSLHAYFAAEGILH